MGTRANLKGGERVTSPDMHITLNAAALADINWEEAFGGSVATGYG